MRHPSKRTSGAIPPPSAKEWRWSGDRLSEIARLVPLWPGELSDRSPSGRARLIAHLTRALRLERQRGRAGHWTYDLSRHAALYRALQCERAEAALMSRTLQLKKKSGPS